MPSPKFQAYNIKEIYHEFGRYKFKVVLNQRYFKSGHDFSVKMHDSSNTPMNFSYEIWGRKLNVEFVVDDNVSDGVMKIDINRGDASIGRLTAWIIKP